MSNSTIQEKCDVCIIGAGISGLNALFCACQYLPKNSKIILLDSKQSYGGMWLHTYPYVSLHQPYELFTVGNLKWNKLKNKQKGYLASRNEIIEHFKECLDIIKKKNYDIIEIYNCTYIQHLEEVVSSRDNNNHNYANVKITCRDNNNNNIININAKKLVKAFGLSVPINKPLKFTSSNNGIHSISVEDPELLLNDDSLIKNSNKPIYIIGGGKTAMDTAYYLIQNISSSPTTNNREINMIIGKGTSFINREKIFPNGIRKYYLTGNVTFGEFMSEHALLYNGDNEVDVMNHLKQHYGINIDSDSEQCMCGILSVQENEYIRNGINRVIRDYVSDIIQDGDDDDKLIMMFRSGKSIPIEKGSWIINCTGYLYREKQQSTYEPYLSELGGVLSIQQTSGIMMFPSIGSYFLTSLFFLNKLHTIPFYELDHGSLSKKNKNDYIFVAMILSLYNMMLISDHAPIKVIYDCNLNLDKWYPLYRQLKTGLYIKYYQSYYMNHCKNVLDYVGEKYDVHCGVLDHVASSTSIHVQGKQYVHVSTFILAFMMLLGSYFVQTSFL